MLLCCFKEPKRTQSEEKVDEPDESYGTVTVGKTTETSNRLIRVAKKERAPLNKEEKRLIKQKSRESLRLQQEAASHAIVTPPDHEDEQVIVVLDGEFKLLRMGPNLIAASHNKKLFVTVFSSFQIFFLDKNIHSQGWINSCKDKKDEINILS